jgi:hypothetical protein
MLKKFKKDIIAGLNILNENKILIAPFNIIMISVKIISMFSVLAKLRNITAI